MKLCEFKCTFHAYLFVKRKLVFIGKEKLLQIKGTEMPVLKLSTLRTHLHPKTFFFTRVFPGLLLIRELQQKSYLFLEASFFSFLIKFAQSGLPLC